MKKACQKAGFRGLIGGRWRRVSALILAGAFVATGCVTPAEHRKLKRKVLAVERTGGGESQGSGLANLSADIRSLKTEIAGLRGRVEVAERKADEALKQAKKARQEAAAAAGEESPAEAGGKPQKGAAVPPGGASAELQSYRESYAAWRNGDAELCIDRFRSFLQTYASSDYADDAAYWMADCHFKQKDYRTAVLRFDDVVRNYPQGNKAPDALYRQAESLLKLGPGYGKAARRAFRRVVEEYPDSAHVPDARRRIELIDAS